MKVLVRPPTQPDLFARHHDIYRGVKKVDFTAIKPKGRPELADPSIRLKELFAGTAVLARIDHLFMLPEIWKFRLDQGEVGLAQGWETPGYDERGGWQPMSVWNWFEDQGYAEVDGRFWYRLKSQAPAFPAGKRVMLRIGSIDDDGEFYLNGKPVCIRNDSTMWNRSFEIDVTDTIRNGQENVIAVRGYDATGGGGIWRPCALYTK